MLTIADIVEINKSFDKGNLVNRSSLDFALSSTRRTKDWITQLAYIIRSITLDHVFEEGNKRTAVAVILAYLKAHKKAYDLYKVDAVIVAIIRKQIQDIAPIRRLLQNAIW